jgi:hypothetical protein
MQLENAPAVTNSQSVLSLSESDEKRLSSLLIQYLSRLPNPANFYLMPYAFPVPSTDLVESPVIPQLL